ncbi:MAG: MBL fold metallo-hydrolase [Desulfobacteraceae bacterium]|nr:MBL fold metallo-hydrolase [Desulfobacteraceae bacterium]
MIIQDPGKVTERITLLGRREATVYYLDGGTEAAIIGGGMVHLVPEVMEQIREFGIDERKISRMVILHSHFDHCGIAPFLKKKWPWVSVAGSEAAKAMLKKPKVVEQIHAMNHGALERANRLEKAKEMGFADFEGLDINEELKEGQKIPIGDRTLEILEVPGHSSCSIAVYVPEEKAMFGSDAGGIMLNDDILVAANSNFDKYQQSLEKMADRDVEIYLAGHYGACTQEDGRNFLPQSIHAAARFRRQIKESLDRTQDPDKTGEELTEEKMKNAPRDFLPREIVSLINRGMANFIFKQL